MNTNLRKEWMADLAVMALIEGLLIFGASEPLLAREISAAEPRGVSRDTEIEPCRVTLPARADGAHSPRVAGRVWLTPSSVMVEEFLVRV